MDLSELLGGGSRRASALAVLADAARRVGVVRLARHGVDLEAVRRAGRAYFALPADLKGCDGCSLRDPSVGFQRGYIPFAAESGLADVLEVKEGFSYGFDWPAANASGHPFQAANVWPAAAAQSALGDGWREAMMGFFNATIGISESVVEALAEALGEQGGPLAGLCADGETISQMRMFNYLPRPPGTAQRCMGSSPHTDWHTLTIIARDSSSVLQYVDRESGRWVNTTSTGEELILLVGDWLASFSGGAFHSAAHRVQLPEQGSSLSFVLFYYPSPSARLPRGSGPGTAPSAASGGGLNTVEDSMFELPWGDYVVRKWAKVMSNR